MDIIKIRPKWDWNIHPSTVYYDDSFVLKSDQNGIEIYWCVNLLVVAFWLKSDQNGIEMINSISKSIGEKKLKSDQNGIEMDRAE